MARGLRAVQKHTGVADEAAEDGVGDAGHGGENGGGGDGDVADLDGSGHTGAAGHGVLDRIVPVLLHLDTDFDVGNEFEQLCFKTSQLCSIYPETLGRSG